MQPYIGRWHCRYRIANSHPDALAAAAHLERRVRGRISEPYSEALQVALQDDPAVYVLRKVELSTVLLSPASFTELSLAQMLGAKLCAGVMHEIILDTPGNLVRFADVPEYIAHYIGDVLSDTAPQRWFYAPFAKFANASKSETIVAVLLENRDCLPSIFRSLARVGALRAALDALTPEAIARLWREGISACKHPPEHDDFRIFVRAAFTISDRLDLWRRPVPNESDFLAAYVAANPSAPNWSDRRSLADAVLAILRFGFRSGVLICPGDDRDISSATVEQDWLDSDYLASSLHSLLRNQTSGGRVQAQADRSGRPTPNQQYLLQRLEQLISANLVALDPRTPMCDSNLLRLYSAVAASEPELASKPATESTLRALLAAWEALLQSQDPYLLLKAIEGGRALNDLTGTNAGGEEPFVRLARLGPTGHSILSALLASRSVPLGQSVGTAVATRCAGLFLLTRALSDCRLEQLAASSKVQFHALLLALALQWSGNDAVHGGFLDPGVVIWCGIDSGVSSPAQALSPLSLERATDILADLEHANCSDLLQRIRSLMRDRAALDPHFTQDDSEVGELPITANARFEVSQLATQLVRLWAQWLPGVRNASANYLLSNFIRRPGTVHRDTRTIGVSLQSAPLDVVLQMSGYLDDFPQVPWLGDRKLSFTLERRPA